MKATLKPGLQFVQSQHVDPGRTIAFMGEEARVYASSRIIGDIEFACRCFLLEHLDPGEDTVGVRACFEHRATGIPDTDVEIRARVVEVDGRRVRFEASVHDAVEEIMRGSHDRFVVEARSAARRIADKRRKLGK